MSYVDPSKLKGNLDTSISFFTTTIDFTNAVLIIDALSNYGAYIKEFRIVNQDGTNNLSYIQGDLSQPSKVVPPNSEADVSGWESFIQITPNAVTGAGFVEM